MFPNRETKTVGQYVENVHPCATYSDRGVVIQAERDYDLITVRVGTGSTVYGPAENWASTDRKPEWMSA